MSVLKSVPEAEQLIITDDTRIEREVHGVLICNTLHSFIHALGCHLYYYLRIPYKPDDFHGLTL